MWASKAARAAPARCGSAPRNCEVPGVSPCPRPCRVSPSRELIYRRLPYGEWPEPDGSRVLFSRGYRPLWRIRPNGSVEAADPGERVHFTDQRWFFDDANPPWRCACTLKGLLKLLADCGMPSAPFPRFRGPRR